MSLNWDFNKEYIGRYETKRMNEIAKYNIYSSNGLFVVCWESKKQYQLITFAADEQHLKNCIQGDMYKGDKFIFNTNVNKYELAKIKKIVKLLISTAQIEIRTPDNPIDKWYYTTEVEE